MSTTASQGTTHSRIICATLGGEFPVSFESAGFTRSASVQINIGPIMGLITREELAAAAALFPVDKGER
jgi:hypothetical protein